MEKTLVLLSGGFDSVTAILDMAMDEQEENGAETMREKIVPLFIHHNYRARPRELAVAIKVAGAIGLPLVQQEARKIDLERGSRQHEVDMLVIAPDIAKAHKCRHIMFGEDVGIDRNSIEEYERVTVPGGIILDGADDWYRDHGYSLDYISQFAVPRMMILKSYLKAYTYYGLSPIWDTYSCFSIVGKDQECGGCWKCFRKYMTCRSVFDRKDILPRFKNDPVSTKNIKLLSKLISDVMADPLRFDPDPNEPETIRDLQEMYRYAVDDMATLVDLHT